MRQGDTKSPKLFNLTIEKPFRHLKWQNKGILINGKGLNHLRFANDVVLIAQHPEDLKEILTELNERLNKDYK